VAGEELVERVLAGDVETKSAPRPPGAPPHLPQARDGAGKRDDDGGVERPNVDPELECIGRDDGGELAGHQPAFDLAPLRRRVAGPVGRDPLRDVVRPDPFELERREAAHELDSLARAHEADHARPVRGQACEELRRLAERRAAQPERLIDDGRVPDCDLAPGRGAPSSSISAISSRPVRRSASSTGFAIVARPGGSAARFRRRPRSGAIAAGRSPRANRDPAIDMRLIDDNGGQVREKPPPGGVVGKDPDMEHVGICEDQIGAPPDLGTRLTRRVAVVDRGAHRVAEAERA